MDLNSNKFIHTVSGDVRKVCKDLFRTTPIKYFNYVRVSEEGLSALFTHPDYLEYTLIEGFGPSLDDLSRLPKICLLQKPEDAPHYEREGVLKNAKYLEEKVGVHDMLTFNYHMKNGLEIFAFALDKNCKLGANYYFNNLDKLEHFMLYFKEKSQCLIRAASKEGNFIVRPSSNLETQEKNFCENNNFKEQWESSIVGNLGLVNITPGELKCLSYIVRGYTAKQAAKFLQKSNRTVESHLYRLKDKLGCRTKNELIILCEHIFSKDRL